jgi:hypothetical protein
LPLNAASLQSDLETLFANPPPAAAGCAQAWANALGSYAAGIVPPSTTVTAAAAGLISPLQSAFASPSAASAFDAALATFATTVGAGMVPTFTGTPPPAPLNVASLMSTTRETHAQAASDFSSLIDLWMKTGIATLVAPPNTTQPWA